MTEKRKRGEVHKVEQYEPFGMTLVLPVSQDLKASFGAHLVTGGKEVHKAIGALVLRALLPFAKDDASKELMRGALDSPNGWIKWYVITRSVSIVNHGCSMSRNTERVGYDLQLRVKHAAEALRSDGLALMLNLDVVPGKDCEPLAPGVKLNSSLPVDVTKLKAPIMHTTMKGDALHAVLAAREREHADEDRRTKAREGDSSLRSLIAKLGSSSMLPTKESYIPPSKLPSDQTLHTYSKPAKNQIRLTMRLEPKEGSNHKGDAVFDVYVHKRIASQLLAPAANSGLNSSPFGAASKPGYEAGPSKGGNGPGGAGGPSHPALAQADVRHPLTQLTPKEEDACNKSMVAKEAVVPLGRSWSMEYSRTFEFSANRRYTPYSPYCTCFRRS